MFGHFSILYMGGLTMPQMRNILNFFLDIGKWIEKSWTKTYLETTQTSERLTVIVASHEKTPS